MTDFEGDLRARLAEASALAPAFRARPQSTPSTGVKRRHRVGLPVALAMVVVLMACSWGVWWSFSEADTQPSAGALCEATATFEGATYARHSDIPRHPRLGGMLGQATPTECPGSPQEPAFDVWEVAGYSPNELIASVDGVWINEAADSSAANDLSAPVFCSDSETQFTVVGSVQGVGSAGEVERGDQSGDNQAVAPFTLNVKVERGPAWLVGDDEAVDVDVNVSAKTAGAEDSTIKAALQGGASTSLELRCDSSAFEVVALTVHR